MSDLDWKTIRPSGAKTEASVVFVGSFPTQEEVRNGEPFSAAGHYHFNSILNKTGLVKADSYNTYLSKLYQPMSEREKWVRVRKHNYQYKVSISDAYVQAREALKEELTGITANVIVAVGAEAMYALCGMLHINKRRGSIYTCTLLERPDGTKYKVIPIIDPITALKEFTYNYMIYRDLETKVKPNMEYPDIRLPERNYILAPTYTQTLEYLNKCQQSDYVAFDIEVLNYEVSCISFAPNPNEAISIQLLAEGKRNVFSPDQETHIWLKIASILEDESIAKITQNGVFDATFLLDKYGIHTTNIEDTMVAAGILQPDFPKGLDFLTSYYTLDNYYKDEGKLYFKSWGEDDTSFLLYNAKDSAITFTAYENMMKVLEQQNMMGAYKRQIKLIPILCYWGVRGIRTNVDGMRKASHYAERHLARLQRMLDSYAGDYLAEGESLNIGSSKQMIQYFYVHKKYKPIFNRKSGNMSVDAKALDKLIILGSKEAKVVKRMREVAKLKSTYFDMIIDNDNRMRSSFNPVGTDQGRLSSSKTIFNTGANLQNQPYAMKKYLLADEGCIVYNIDLAQAENRCVAYFSDETSMIEAFENEEDLHKKTAGMIFRKSIEDITGDERKWGKRANHGLNYDFGYKSFAALYDVEPKFAKFVVDSYHTAYPMVRAWHRRTQYQIQETRQLTNPYGRTRQFIGRLEDSLYKIAYSFMPQSTVADKINQDAMIPIFYEDAFQDVELLLQVHDSIVIQMPISLGIERHIELLLKIKNIAETPVPLVNGEFTIPVDCGVGYDFRTPTELWNYKDLLTLTPDDVRKKLSAYFK